MHFILLCRNTSSCKHKFHFNWLVGWIRLKVTLNSYGHMVTKQKKNLNKSIGTKEGQCPRLGAHLHMGRHRHKMNWKCHHAKGVFQLLWDRIRYNSLLVASYDMQEIQWTNSFHIPQPTGDLRGLDAPSWYLLKIFIQFNAFL